MRSDLRARILTAAIGIPIVLFVVWLGGAAFALTASILALIGMRELEMTHRKASTSLVSLVAYPALVLILSLSWFYARAGVRTHFAAPILFFSLWLIPIALLVFGVLAFGTRQKISLASVAMTQLAVSYVGLFAFLILLRSFPAGGLQLFWIVIFGVWTGDSLAYFAGRIFGKTPLTMLSPKKTREGTIAGVLGAFVVCFCLALFWKFRAPDGVAIGVLVAVMAPLGDLAESFWKRELEVKDLGALLPGHGGVLDRCDSLLFASFAVYLYAQWQL